MAEIKSLADYASSTTPGPSIGGSVGSGGQGLMNQIPQAVTQAVQPIVEQAASNINSTLGTGGSSGMSYSRPPYQVGGMIFDQYRQPGNFGKFISPSEMAMRDPNYTYTPPTQLFAEGGMATQAQNLASKGRGEDKMLVHMTPSEVSGLQALAVQQGGSLTINPETGLPEAGFLSDTFKAIAPTIIGAGLTYFSGGAINPYMAAGIVGGVEGIRKNDLGAGLMAGLGAFGGANLVGGLAGFGAGAGAGAGAGGAGMVNAANVGGANLGAAGMAGAQPTTLANLGSAARAGAGAATTAGTTTGSLMGNTGGALITPGATTLAGQSVSTVPQIQMAGAPAGNLVSPTRNLVSPATFTDVPIVESGFQAGTPDFKAFTGTGEQQLVTSFPRQETAPIFEEAINVREGVVPSYRQNIDAGIAKLGQEGGFSEFAKNYPGGKLGLAALAAGPTIGVLDAAGAFDQEGYAMPEAGAGDADYDGPYEPTPRDVRFRGREAILAGDGREFSYFTPVNPYPAYQKINAAKGGLMEVPRYGFGGMLTNLVNSGAVKALVDKAKGSSGTATSAPLPEYEYVPAPENYRAGIDPEHMYFVNKAAQANSAPTSSSNKVSGSLEGYAAGGRFLQGNGDGTSDSIPAMIGNDQPARLADGEFVVDARTVSEIGNGSSDAGAKKLYALMDNVHKARRSAERGKPSGADQLLKGLVPTA
jgi:hypothetical protein